MRIITACILGLLWACAAIGGEDAEGKKIVNKISKEDRRVYGAFGYVPKACPWVEVETRPKTESELKGQTPVTFVEKAGKIITRHEHLIWAPDEYTTTRNRWSASAPPGKRVYITIQGFCRWKNPPGGQGGGQGGGNGVAVYEPPKWWSSGIDLDIDADTARDGLANVTEWSKMTDAEKLAEPAEDKGEDKTPVSFSETRIQGALVAIGAMTPMRLRRILPADRPQGEVTISRTYPSRTDVLVKERKDGKDVFTSIFAKETDKVSKDIWEKVKNADCELFLAGRAHGHEVLRVRFRNPGNDKKYDTADDLSATDLVRVAVSMDLSIDSDNDGEIERFQDGDDDGIEDDADKPGKIVVANRDDDDFDGVPDYADGYTLGTTENVNDSEDDFALLELRICGGGTIPAEKILDEDVARVRVTYVNADGTTSASNPSGVTRSANPPYSYSPAAGRLRLWKRSGSFPRDGRPINAPRKNTKEEFDAGGHYIPPGEYTFTQLGLLDLHDSGVFSSTLYVEGISPSAGMADQRIIVEVDPDGPEGPAQYVLADAVRVTVTGLEFTETPEMPEDILPMFNPNPIVTLDAVANPGNAEQVRINITGRVKDYVAPVTSVRVNGADVAVTQVSTGTGGMGPFEGTFRTQFNLTGHTTLIEALAINSLNNLGKDSVLIAVNRNAAFAITGRTVTAHASVPSAPANDNQMMQTYSFRLELADPTVKGNVCELTLKTGVGNHTVRMSRANGGIAFRSGLLYFCPGNLKLAANVSEAIKNSRLKGEFGKRWTVETEIQVSQTQKVTYRDYASPFGVMFYKATDGKIADFVESCVYEDVVAATKSRSYVVRAGFPGASGEGVSVTLRGLDRMWNVLSQPQPANLFPALAPTLVLRRASNDRVDGHYDLYKADETKPIMATKSRLPLNAARQPEDNAKLTEVFCVYDGALIATAEIGSFVVGACEPTVGMEIVAENPLVPGQYKAAESGRSGGPLGPIVSVSDGAPRPRVRIQNCTYVPGPGNTNLLRMRVTGEILDPVADVTPGSTLNALRMAVEVNGSALAMSPHAAGTPAVPGDGVRIHRPGAAPSSLRITFDALVDLRRIPNNGDRDAYRANTSRGLRGNNVTIAQQAVIVRVRNAIGNTAFDSAFVRIVDEGGDLTPPYTCPTPAVTPGAPPAGQLVRNQPRGVVNDQERRPALPAAQNINRPTYAKIPAQKFTIMHNNPFVTGLTLANRTVASRLADGNALHSKRIQLTRGSWGDAHVYGPFIAGCVDRAVRNPAAIPDALPVVTMLRFQRNANGNITGYEAAARLMASAPGNTAADVSECMTMRLRLDSRSAGLDNRDAYLPGHNGTAAAPVATGTDANPEVLRVILDIQPSYLLPPSRRLKLILRNPTNFAGHCGNAPRGGGTDLDFSFSRANNAEQTPWMSIPSAGGQVATQLFCKDFGGRVTIEARLNMAGDPAVLMEIPLDTDGDFLPDAWERRFRNPRAGTVLANPIRDGLVDDEERDVQWNRVIHNEAGDGFTALEEYRGFQVTDTPAAGGARTRVFRMDEVPFAYGLAAHRNAGAASPIAGPLVKDLFVFHQSTVVNGAAGNLAMNAHNARLFNVAWHRILEVDFPANMQAATIVNDLRVNANGNNDGFRIPQYALHLRDDNGLAAPNDDNGDGVAGGAGDTIDDNERLPAGVLGVAGGFFPSPRSVRINVGAAGSAFPATFGHDLINGNTIFHELGHEVGLKHNITWGGPYTCARHAGSDNTNLLPGAAHPGNEGVATVTVGTYNRFDGTALMSGALPFGEASRLRVGGTEYPLLRAMVDPAGPVDGLGNRRRAIVLIEDPVWVPPGPPPAPAIDYRGVFYDTDLMDWMDNWARGGPQAQRDLDGQQFPLTGARTLHSNEVRIKTCP